MYSLKWRFMSRRKQPGHQQPGTRPINDISIEFEIQPKYAVFWVKINSTDHNETLHTSRKCNCRDVCKIWL